jgi:porin
MLLRTASLAAAAALTATAALAEEADEPAASLQIAYTADVSGAAGSGARHAGKYLDNLDIIGEADLERTIGWRGAAGHIYILNNSGGAPNDLAGTLQGVDNIEVATPRLRLFELWVDQSFAGGKASLLGGLYNLNSEFYANEAAGRLLNPSFGIGSELAATGPNGPSIFPSTALGLRLNLSVGEHGYARAAVLNAHSGVVGDPKGIDFSFDDGVLSIAEAGVEGDGKISFGAWRYSRKQDDIRDVDGAGDPLRVAADGAYLLAEKPLFGGEGERQATAFLRVGVSDARTTPFRGGWQAGFHIARPIASRPDSELAFGLQQGLLSQRFRANLRDVSVDPKTAESGVELTYADKLTSRVTIQPDLQWVRLADAPRDADSRWIATLRVRVELGSQP